VSRQSYKGYSVRVIPYYNGSNDISAWRLDLLYGVKCSTRVSRPASAARNEPGRGANAPPFLFGGTVTDIGSYKSRSKKKKRKRRNTKA
jgi:hypothetical protein